MRAILSANLLNLKLLPYRDSARMVPRILNTIRRVLRGLDLIVQLKSSYQPDTVWRIRKVGVSKRKHFDLHPVVGFTDARGRDRMPIILNHFAF